MGYKSKEIILNISILNDQKYIRRCSTYLAIRETQIRMTLRFDLRPVRMAKFKNTSDSLCWRGCGARVTHLHCWWECKFVQYFVICNLVWPFIKELGGNLPNIQI